MKVSTEARRWPALVIEAARPAAEELVAALLDDFSPAAIEDLAILPIPPGGLWDPALEPPPDLPPAPLHWRVFFDTSALRDAAAEALRARLPDLAVAAVDVPDDDWAARSQQSITCIRAGGFLVAPPWDLPATGAPDLVTIVIEPSRGFGTGHHASTRLCLRALSELDVRGARVLDLGTGSGVLAMAAALKGAHEVTAVDVDPDAIDAARASAALNVLPIDIDFVVADFRRAGETEAPAHRAALSDQYDLVFANLTGGMLISAAARIQRLVAPSGALVISGFEVSERDRVRARFAGMRPRAEYSEDGWAAVVLV